MDPAEVFARSAAHKDVNVWDAALLRGLLAAVGNASARLPAQLSDVVKKADVGARVSGVMDGSNPFFA